jgi:putative transposase
MDQDTLRFLLREAVRETVTEVLQTVLELDRTAFLQAHGGRRNGYYPRKLETTFGQVDLKVPRDREGQYYPAFLKPYARRLVDVGEVAVALYAAGVSQRKAAEVMCLLLGHRYSHETISAMTEEVLQAVEAFRRRPLPEEMAFVYLDGLYLKLLREGEGVVREVVYVALGVTPSGERRVLGYWLLPAESALGWEGVLGELWQRGAQAGAALHHRWASGSTRSHPTGLPSGGVAAVRGARGAVEPGAGAGAGPDPLGGRPEAGVRGGEPGGGS